MAGFGTGFSGTFAPTARLGLIDKQMERDQANAAIPTAGRSKPIFNDTPIGGPAIASPQPVARKAAASPAEAPAIPQKDGWNTLMDEKAMLQARDFDLAQGALIQGDGVPMSEYTKKYGNPDRSFDYLVDGEKILVMPMDKSGMPLSDKPQVFNSHEDWYKKMGAFTTPRDGRGNPISISTYKAEMETVGNENTGFYRSDKGGIYEDKQVTEPMSPALKAAGVSRGGGSGTDPSTLKASDMLDNIRAYETKRASIDSREGVAAGVLQPEIDQARMDMTWKIRDYQQALTEKYPEIARQHGYTTLVPSKHVTAMIPYAEQSKAAKTPEDKTAILAKVTQELADYEAVFGEDAANELEEAMYKDWTVAGQKTKKKKNGRK